MNSIETEKLIEENKALKEKIKLLKQKDSQENESSQDLSLFQMLIDGLSALVFIKDVNDEYKYVIVNDEYCKAKNKNRDEIIGKDDFQLYSPEEAKRYRLQDEKTCSSKNITIMNDTVLEDGERVTTHLTKQLVRLSPDKEYIVCISNYISKDIQKNFDQKNDIDNEAETSNMMTSIFQELPSAILIKDIEDDYRFYLVNRKFEQMMNTTESNLIGKTDFEIFPEEEAQKYRRDDTESSLFTKDNPNIIEEVVYSPDRKKATHLKTLKFSFNYKKKKLLICVGIDVTEQYRITNQLKETLKKAQAAEKLKNLFIANMSHEIRTPLNAIVGFSQLLMETQDNDERNEFYKIIKYNNDLLISLINDILSLSLIEAGVVDLQEEAFDFSAMFNSTATILSTKIDNPQIEFINGNTRKEVIIKSDELKITQIINNLVNNAIKFTNYGFIKMNFDIIDTGIEVTIEDTGIGIKEEDKERIFQRFEKVDPYTQGTGLGLSICKSLAEQFGGNIEVKSSFGKGSIFLFRFPCKIISQ